MLSTSELDQFRIRARLLSNQALVSAVISLAFSFMSVAYLPRDIANTVGYLQLTLNASTVIEWPFIVDPILYLYPKVKVQLLCSSHRPNGDPDAESLIVKFPLSKDLIDSRVGNEFIWVVAKISVQHPEFSGFNYLL